MIAVALATGTAAATQESLLSWTDPSPHRVQFVNVDQDVTLEVLDWGGSGPTIVLLAGSGNTAHVFDDFAPKLTACCHVYGITRRGFGASGKPRSGYDAQRLAEDVFQVLQRAGIPAPVVVGHSMAGDEMMFLGNQHSARLRGLVFLDGLADLEDDPAADPEWQSLQQKLPAGLNRPPQCGPANRSSFAAYRLALACQYGFRLPQSELRQMFETVDDGGVGPSTTPEWVRPQIAKGQVFRKDFTNVRAPVMALQNAANTTEELLAGTGYEPENREERAAIDRFVIRSLALQKRWADKLIRHVPDARIVNLGLVGHYVFVTAEEQVLQEVQAFMAALPEQPRR